MSLFGKLKNLIDMKLSNVLDTPEATAFAAEKAQEKAEEKAADKKVEDATAAKKAEEDRIKELEAAKPPSVGKSALNSFMKTWAYGLAAFFATILGSMCANAAIHRHQLIRLLMFIYGSVVGTFGLIAVLPFLLNPISGAIVVGLFVIFIIIVSISSSLRSFFPHFYAYLPLSTYQSPRDTLMGKIVWYLLALFTYDPKSDYNKDHLSNKESTYKKILLDSLSDDTKNFSTK
jgi:hypothetical protein